MTHEYHSATDRAPAETEPELRAAVTADRTHVRRDAALALVSKAPGGLEPVTVDTLAGRVRTDDDPDVRQFSVEALGVDGSPTPPAAAEALDAIRHALTDEHEWVRAEAVVAHSRVAPDDPDTLRELLEADDSGWVRRNAVVALGKHGHGTQDVFVDRITNDPHPAVREYAAQFLSDVVEDEGTVERILAALLAREPNAFVRAKAAESLGALATDRAEDALETHGITDQSDDVVRTATRALADARGTDPEHLDVEVDVDPSGSHAPGSGPDAPGDRFHDGHARQPGGGPGRRSPGGAPGFDPENHLDGALEDR
jgi:HEAT repeat protein